MDPINSISNNSLLYQQSDTTSSAQDTTKKAKVKVVPQPNPHPQIDAFNKPVFGTGDIYFVDKIEWQPFGNEVWNIKDFGNGNDLVNKSSVGLGLGANLTIPSIGLLNALSVNYDNADYTYGGGDAGNNRNFSLNLQTLIPEKKYLDKVFPSISGDPLFKGKEWYQQPAEALRMLWRWPSYLKDQVDGLSDGWKAVGMLADIPLTVLKFAAEDIPNSLIGGQVRYSFIDNSERDIPNFYDPSVKAAGINLNAYWALGNSSFITTSYERRLGTKEYTLGLPHRSDDRNWAVRFDAPNILDENWGLSFLRLHPWAEFRKGRDQLQISSSSTVTTTETDPITLVESDTTNNVSGRAAEIQIAYSKLSGGVNMYLFDNRLEAGVALSKETRQMQKDRQTTEYHLTYGPATLKYSQIQNPIMFYHMNTNLPEEQNRFEFEFDPRYYTGSAGQFIPSVVIGYEKTWVDNGGLRTIKDNFPYFGIKFSLRLSGRKQKQAVCNYGNEQFINASDVTNIMGNNKYTSDRYLTYKIVQNLKIDHEKALKTCIYNMLPNADDITKAKDKERAKLDDYIKDFKTIVRQKGLASDEATAKKTEIDKYIKELSTTK